METMTQEMEISCEQQVSVFEQVMEPYAYKVMETFCVKSMEIYGAAWVQVTDILKVLEIFS